MITALAINLSIFVKHRPVLKRGCIKGQSRKALDNLSALPITATVG